MTVTPEVQAKAIEMLVPEFKKGGLTHEQSQKLAEKIIRYQAGNAEATGLRPGDVPLTDWQVRDCLSVITPPSPKAAEADVPQSDGPPRLQGSSIDEKEVLDYLQEHYPNADIGWVRRCLWAADNVLLSDVNWENRPGGVDQDKVDDMSAKLQDGWQPKPVVVIAPDQDSPMEVADGYHRFAAYDDAGIDAARAWVATPKPGNQGWRADVQAMQWSANNWKPPDKGKALTKGEVAALHKAGNPEALREWYNEGADGQIDWGSPGDFDACVSVASRYIDDAEGFCNLRHQDATGEPPGKAPGEADKTIRVLPPDLVKIAEPGDRLDDDETGERWLIKAVRGNEVWIVKFSEDEARDEHGRWTDGGGGSGNSAAATAEDLAERMNAGQTVHLNQATVASCVATWAASTGPIALQNATVSGAGNQNLFAVGNLGIPRENMPQIPGDSATIGKFENLLRGDGVKFKEQDVDPRTLKATQSELDGRKVSQIELSLEKSGGKLRAEGATLVVSQDGHVLDGHHRWSAATIYAVSHSSETVHVLRVNEDIRPLLNQAEQFDETQGIAHQTFGHMDAGFAKKGSVPGDDWQEFTPRPEGAEPPDPSKPYMWVGDHWVLLARDTDDGVPRSLT